MKKKNWRLRHRTVFSRDTCWGPTQHHYLSKPGGGGGGLGGVAYKDPARPPPPGPLPQKGGFQVWGLGSRGVPTKNSLHFTFLDKIMIL